MGVRVVAADLEILVDVAVDRVRAALDPQPGERARVAGELEAGLVEVVRVKVAVAAGPDEGAGLEAALIG